MRWLPSLPLLRRELAERALRAWTYWSRVLVGVACIVVCLGVLGRLRSADTLLGSGRLLFESLLPVAWFGIVVLVPISAAAGIAKERERGMLPLLLISGMSLSQILRQHLIAALIPALSVVLVALPFLACCFALGGLQPLVIVAGTLSLAAAALQSACLGVLCGSYCRHMASAVILALTATAVLHLVLPWVVREMMLDRDVQLVLGAYSQTAMSYGRPPTLMWSQVLAWMEQPFSWGNVAAGTIAALVSALVFAWWARRKLVEALSPPAKRLQRLFTWIDRTWGGLDRRIAPWLWRRRAHLPKDQPVLWRATARRLANSHRVIVAGMLIAIAAVLSLTIGHYNHAFSLPFEAMLAIGMGIAVVLAMSSACGALGAERSGTGLDVLMTTALRPRDLVRQYARALTRLTWAMRVPLALLMLFIDTETTNPVQPGVVVMQVTMLWFVPLIAVWAGLLAAVRVRNRVFAQIVGLVGILLLIYLPLLIPRFLPLDEFFGHLVRDCSPLVGLDLAVAPSSYWYWGRQEGIGFKLVVSIGTMVGWWILLRVLALRLAHRIRA